MADETKVMTSMQLGKAKKVLINRVVGETPVENSVFVLNELLGSDISYEKSQWSQDCAVDVGVCARLRAALAHERAERVREREDWRRKLLLENRLLEAVLCKYNVSIVDARAALAELDGVSTGPPMAYPVSPATALSPRVPMERDPSYVRFATMASRGRRHRRKRSGAWCAP
jgi:hypothetical protein